MLLIILENLKLIVFSFVTSFGLGIVFQIEKRFLVWAGLGGALTRIVYLGLLAATDMTFLQALLPAIFAALYAELMAMRMKTPSTVFLYPAILPLIPGTAMYYIAVNLILGDQASALSWFWECCLSLGGICLGFVLISTFTYYRRLYYVGENIGGHLRRWLQSRKK